MICTARHVLGKHLPFKIDEGAHFCLPSAAASVTEWDDLQDLLNMPYIPKDDWSDAIVHSIALELEALVRNAGRGEKVKVQDVSALFPKIEVERFKMKNWEEVIKNLPNVKSIKDGVIELKDRKRPKPGKLSIGKQVRVQVILDGECLLRTNEAGLTGPRGCGINANALLNFISSRLGESEIISKMYLSCKAEAVDGVRDVMEEKLKTVGFQFLAFPAGKRKAVQTKMFGLLKSALKSQDIDAVALLSGNDHFEWLVEDLVHVGTPVLLLSSDGRSSRLSKAASQSVDLGQLATKIHSRKHLDNALFSTGNFE